MKPTKAQIETASDQQLAEWSAVYLKKWETGYPRDTWWDDNASDHPCWCVEEKGELKRVIDKSNWNPAQNIGQAFSLIESDNPRIQFHGL